MTWRQTSSHVGPLIHYINQNKKQKNSFDCQPGHPSTSIITRCLYVLNFIFYCYLVSSSRKKYKHKTLFQNIAALTSTLKYSNCLGSADKFNRTHSFIIEIIQLRRLDVEEFFQSTILCILRICLNGSGLIEKNFCTNSQKESSIQGFRRDRKQQEFSKNRKIDDSNASNI
ncbi:hypothetical protein pb186bvf_002527 [Paramecium bursaria]